MVTVSKKAPDSAKSSVLFMPYLETKMVAGMTKPEVELKDTKAKSLPLMLSIENVPSGFLYWSTSSSRQSTWE